MQDQLQQLYHLSTKNHLEEVFKGIQPIRESLDSLSHFTKGVFTNALAELIYSGMLRIGDDVVIRKLLELMRQDADLPLSKNIERVLAALDYLTDQDSA